ncbi:DHS-like NAD/FAD-binding domain-containing protein [Gonapodya prolifera JEL478]|uniref:DHS-like NAD/FAD-binding domain-containing protein n=1 Tax=Gonapodya prolifera (strain JEL478) TaxID=1344416 RepID=A0A139AXF3_GONPJ|nr:DHS-like NAD/FAD-binding domain-containing protein [Gonapodya prolifera JEL478]|eukprot:KXS21408.1 DHS-like NAD/FAD-binding domain-containing protein [Gonapodya prolifera JEL478]
MSMSAFTEQLPIHRAETENAGGIVTHGGMSSDIAASTQGRPQVEAVYGPLNETMPDQAPANGGVHDSSLAALAECWVRSSPKRIVDVGRRNLHWIGTSNALLPASYRISDFCIPGTSLYDKLQAYNLPEPESMFDINNFHQLPQAFFILAKELFSEQCKPTLAHYYINLQQDIGILLTALLKRVDRLRSHAALVAFTTPRFHFPNQRLLSLMGARITVSRNHSPQFHNLMAYPSKIQARASLECDILIVMGTSLKLAPFQDLIDLVRSGLPRLLINSEEVGTNGLSNEGFDFRGDLQAYRRDALHLSTIDLWVRDLARLLGWEDELLRLYECKTQDLEQNWAVGKRDVGFGLASGNVDDPRPDSFAQKVTKLCRSMAFGAHPDLSWRGTASISNLASLALPSDRWEEVMEVGVTEMRSAPCRDPSLGILQMSAHAVQVVQVQLEVLDHAESPHAMSAVDDRNPFDALKSRYFLDAEGVPLGKALHVPVRQPLSNVVTTPEREIGPSRILPVPSEYFGWWGGGASAGRALFYWEGTVD